MKEKINILIADDNQDFSHTLSTYINSQEDMQVIGMARDGEEAVEMINNTTPDIYEIMKILGKERISKRFEEAIKSI